MRRLQRFTIMAIAMVAVSTISQQKAAAVEPTYLRIHDREMFCRATEVLVERLKYLKPSLRALGARLLPVEQLEGSATTLRTRACAIPVQPTTVRDALLNFGEKWQRVLTQVSNQRGFTQDEAVAAIHAQFGYETDRLATACGGAIEQGLQYVLDGSGNDAFHAALGPNCDPGASASSLRTPANIVDPDPGIQNCLTQYVEQTSQCEGWASDDDDPAPDNPAPDNPEPAEPPPADDDGEGHEIRDLALEGAEAAAALGKAVAAVGVAASFFPPTAPAGPAIIGFGAGLTIVGEGTKAFIKALNAWEHATEDGGENDSSKLCPSADLASRPAFARQDEGRKTDVIDVMQQCVCEAVHKAAAANASPGLRGLVASLRAYGWYGMQQSGFCMSETEKERVECVRYPYGPDDGITRECRDSIRADNSDITDDDFAPLCERVIQCPFNHRVQISSPRPDNPDLGCKCANNISFPGYPGSSAEDEQCQVLTCEHGRPFLGTSGCRCPLEPIEPRPVPPEPWF